MRRNRKAGLIACAACLLALLLQGCVRDVDEDIEIPPGEWPEKTMRRVFGTNQNDTATMNRGY